MAICGCLNSDSKPVSAASNSAEDEAMKARSLRIDRQLREDERRMRRTVKLLLLGAGESGKSTFLKQMKIIHGVKFDEDQLADFRQIIYVNLLRGMQVRRVTFD